MKKQLVPEDVSHVMAAYSPGISYDFGNAEMIFVTGQIAKDEAGNVIGVNDIAKQTEFVFEKIKAILAVADATLEDLVKVVIYITDMDKYKIASEIRNRYLATSKPVSTLVEINRTVSEGCEIEIDAIAIKNKDKE